MNAIKTPSIRWLNQSQLGDDTTHSLIISLLRGLAAIEVAAAHLRAEFFPGLRSLDNPTLWYQALAFFTGFAHQAVVVFFLISGWLVGGSLLNRLGQPEAVKLYAIDRITRLWTVLIPTFVLVLALGIMNGTLDPRSADFSAANPYSATSFLGNLVGLQTVTLFQFGGNFPLWSLANETWYYLMFPLLMLTLTSKRTGGRTLPALLLLATAAVLPGPMVLYFAIWLLGAAFSRIQINCSAGARFMLVLLIGAVAVLFRLKGANDDMNFDSFGQDLVLSIVVLLLLSSSIVKIDPANRLLARLRSLAVFFSNFSFTLYVVHIPVLSLLGYLGVQLLGRRQLDPGNLADLVLYFGLLGFVLVFSYGFYLLFEARTYAVRRFLKNLLVGRMDVQARAAPAKH